MRKRVNLLHQNFAALLFEVIGFLFKCCKTLIGAQEYMLLLFSNWAPPSHSVELSKKLCGPCALLLYGPCLQPACWSRPDCSAWGGWATEDEEYDH